MSAIITTYKIFNHVWMQLKLEYFFINSNSVIMSCQRLERNIHCFSFSLSLKFTFYLPHYRRHHRHHRHHRHPHRQLSHFHLFHLH